MSMLLVLIDFAARCVYQCSIREISMQTTVVRVQYAGAGNTRQRDDMRIVRPTTPGDQACFLLQFNTVIRMYKTISLQFGQ